MSRKNIAIEDVSGYFGQLLLPLLEDDPEVKLVIGIDRHPPPSSKNWNKLSFHQLDIRDPSLGEVLANAMHYSTWRLCCGDFQALLTAFGE